MIKRTIYENQNPNQIAPNAELERINSIRHEENKPLIGIISHRRAATPPIYNIRSTPNSTKLTPLMRYKTGQPIKK